MRDARAIVALEVRRAIVRGRARRGATIGGAIIGAGVRAGVRAVIGAAVRLAEALAFLDLELVPGGAVAVHRVIAGRLVLLAERGGHAVLGLGLALEAGRAVGVRGAGLLDDRAGRAGRGRVRGASGEGGEGGEHRDGEKLHDPVRRRGERAEQFRLDSG